MTIVIATTTCAPYLDVPNRWRSWLANANAIKESVALDHEVRYLAALETDGRGKEPFGAFLAALDEVGGDHVWFSLDDGRTKITTDNRLRHITLGQNIVSGLCSDDPGVEWLLFVAADTALPPDVLPKMLEMDHPLVAPLVTTYGAICRGPAVEGYPAAWKVQDAMASAAAVMIHRDVFKRLRWRCDYERGMTDDPSYRADADELLGIPTYVRGDCEATHWPLTIGSIESRLGPSAVVVR